MVWRWWVRPCRRWQDLSCATFWVLWLPTDLRECLQVPLLPVLFRVPLQLPLWRFPFVNAGLLTLAQAISVIIGANIGTTLTAWIMSLGYNVDLTVVVFPAFFLVLYWYIAEKRRYIGDFVFRYRFPLLCASLIEWCGERRLIWSIILRWLTSLVLLIRRVI